MSEQDPARLMAERIARRVTQPRHVEAVPHSRRADDVAGELAAVRARLDELQQKLTTIESHITEDERTAQEMHSAYTDEQASTQPRGETVTASSPPTRSPWLSGVYVPATHPSQERFGVDEATVSELVDFFEKEKTCGLEPGKSCDHCAMCSSRGF